MRVAMKKWIDPLENYKEGLTAGPGRAARPIPLRATTIAVIVRAGFATVTTARTFRNDEEASVEATLTWPVPVDAVAHGLKVTIDGRELVGVVAAKAGVRQAYEAALDAGGTAILHEEASKGVHVLSVGHVGPGRKVVVETAWSKPLAFSGSAPSLRIPSTVAEVYGRLPLEPADAFLVHDTRVDVGAADRRRRDRLGAPAWRHARRRRGVCPARPSRRPLLHRHGPDRPRRSRRRWP